MDIHYTVLSTFLHIQILLKINQLEYKGVELSLYLNSCDRSGAVLFLC